MEVDRETRIRRRPQQRKCTIGPGRSRTIAEIEFSSPQDDVVIRCNGHCENLSCTLISWPRGIPVRSLDFLVTTCERTAVHTGHCVCVKRRSFYAALQCLIYALGFVSREANCLDLASLRDSSALIVERYNDLSILNIWTVVSSSRCLVLIGLGSFCDDLFAPSWQQSFRLRFQERIEGALRLRFKSLYLGKQEGVIGRFVAFGIEVICLLHTGDVGEHHAAVRKHNLVGSQIE